MMFDIKELEKGVSELIEELNNMSDDEFYDMLVEDGFEFEPLEQEVETFNESLNSLFDKEENYCVAIEKSYYTSNDNFWSDSFDVEIRKAA